MHGSDFLGNHMQHYIPVLACLVVAGCAAPTIVQPPAAQFVPLSPDAFPGASRVLSGFDERSSDAQWQPHDQVLFAVQFEKDGEIVRWLLQLEAPVGHCIDAQITVPGEDAKGIGLEANRTATLTGKAADGTPREWKVTSRIATVAVRVLDAQGTLLAQSDLWLPADTIGRGLLRCIGPVENADLQAWAEVIISVASFLDLLRDDDVLDDYFWQVIEKPSVWSVAANFGVSTSIDLNGLATSVPTHVPPPVPAAEPAYSAPLQILVNGSPALYVDLLATDAQRPYAICGGVVAAAARHPTRADTTFRMQLLAARCGTAAR